MSSGGGDSASANDGGGKRRRPPLHERSPVQVGDIVAEKYQVEALLAAGGMGIVVAARHRTLGQQVAIKFLLSEDGEARKVERFVREARASARIESQRVCRVFDVGTLPSGVPFMVMEHLTGHDMAQELKSRGPMPVSDAVDMVLQALEGLAEAHAVGIIHRDLKPSNLFLSIKPGRPKEVKILDFGISKLAPNLLEENLDEDLTGTAAMLGSPRYMSPEQVKSAKHVDARTDIWSMGVILYQLLEGRSPFSGTTMGETISKVLLHEPPSIAALRHDVPAGLAQVISRCLQRDRDQRYRNVAELALGLAPFGTPASAPSVQRITALLVEGQLATVGSPASAALPPSHPVPSAPSAHAVLQQDADASVGTVSPLTQSSLVDFRPKRSRALLAVGAVLLLAMLAVAVVALRQPAADASTVAAGAPSAQAVNAAADAPQPAVPAALPQRATTAVVAGSTHSSPPASASAPAPSASASATPRPSPKSKPRPKPSNVDDLLSESY
ncbi:MAG: serine/threonine-protein kinase [Polyangiaceae bacterium]